MIPTQKRDGGLGLRLFGDADVPAIAAVLDTVVAARGQPWRVALERLERVPGSATQRASIVAAVRRVLGRSHASKHQARETRALVLGHPALEPAVRTARLAVAASALGITAAQVESAMWGDLALERAVELPEGRPSERALAAIANLDVIQHALRRAHHVVLRVWDDPRELWRVAAVRGLLIAAIPQRDGSTTFEIKGPLALFHQTAVYGRALGALVPPLAEQARFELVIRCDVFGEKVLRVAPPLLLPRAPAPRRPPMALDARLARDLDSTCAVEREPEPIAAGDRLLFPQLRVDDWYIEIIGFATTEFLAEKVARYRAAGIAKIIFCIDEERASEADAAPLRATDYRCIWFRRRISADTVLEMIR